MTDEKGCLHIELSMPQSSSSHDIPASLARLGDYMLVSVNRQLLP